MSAALALRSNKQWVGYSARRVFGGRGSGGLGEFAPGSSGLAGRRRAILAGGQCRAGMAAGLSGSAASILANQPLSEAPIGEVATGWSQRAQEGEESQALKAQRRLIASYRTGRRVGSIELAAARSPRPIGGGGAPLSVRALDPHARSAGRTSIEAKSAPMCRSSLGCIEPASEPRANDTRQPLGSGVRVATNGEESGASGAEKAGLRNGVGGAAHPGFDLGRNGEAAPGRA